jgi:pyridoxamine 5'-phosphate oxidase family protein
MNKGKNHYNTCVAPEREDIGETRFNSALKRKRKFMFSEQERVFLQTQPLARLATVAVDSQPDVDAVGFAFDEGRFYITGYALERTRKYRNIAAGQIKVSLIIDDLKTLQPLEPRAIKIHGEAAILSLEEGYRGPGTYLVLTPKVSWSWGIDGPAFQDGKFVTKKITWE